MGDGRDLGDIVGASGWVSEIRRAAGVMIPVPGILAYPEGQQVQALAGALLRPFAVEVAEHFREDREIMLAAVLTITCTENMTQALRGPLAASLGTHEAAIRIVLRNGTV